MAGPTFVEELTPSDSPARNGLKFSLLTLNVVFSGVEFASDRTLENCERGIPYWLLEIADLEGLPGQDKCSRPEEAKPGSERIAIMLPEPSTYE
jgi:hypothetical protein